MRKSDFSDRRDEYNTGGNIDLKSLKPEELNIALDSLSEGNASLRRLLSICLEKGITTKFSCGGHREEKKAGAYISFEMDEKFMEYIERIFSELSSENGFYLEFSNNGLFRTCNINGEYKIREEIFDIISRGIEKQKGNEEAADEFKNLLSLSKSLENKGYEYSIGVKKQKRLTKVEILDGSGVKLFTRFRDRQEQNRNQLG